MDKKYYFIGIGGISMSSLAVFLKIQGKEVSGSDLGESDNLKQTALFGIDYNIGHLAKNIEEFNPDCVVINFAINEENEELIWAKSNKKKIITRAELLGKISKKFNNVIAVSGTHGKTTTTAMISEIFIEAGVKPTVHIGGISKMNNSNFLIGEKKYFITEACEYKNSFLTLSPSLGIVLNIESDHLDFFKNIEMIKDSFDEFMKNSQSTLVYDGEYHFTMKIKEKKSLIYEAKNIRQNNNGYSFDLFENDIKISKFQTNFLGKHNIKNAVAAIATSLFYKIKLNVIKKAIKNYHGVKRRFEKIGIIGNTVIIHDYAHHPTAIDKVIEQAKNYGKTLTVFQPHTFSRTKSLYNNFLTAFDRSDGLILVKTYAAREGESCGSSAYDIFQSLQDKNPSFDYLSYSNDFEDSKEKVLSKIGKYNCILILGAGDIDKLAENLALK